MRTLRALAWILLPMAASGGLGCSSNSSGATDAGSEAREPSPDAGQNADAPPGSVDASNASTDAGGAQDSACRGEELVCESFPAVDGLHGPTASIPRRPWRFAGDRETDQRDPRGDAHGP